MIGSKEEIRTENIARSIIQDYLYAHSKFPKRVKTSKKEFILYEYAVKFQCTIYHENNDYKKRNLISLQSYIFVWNDIVKVRKTPLLRLK